MSRTWPRRARTGKGTTQSFGEAGGTSRHRIRVESSAPERSRERERARHVMVRGCSTSACNVLPASDETRRVPSQWPPESTTAPRPPSPPARNRLKPARIESGAASWVDVCRRNEVTDGRRPEEEGGHFKEWTVDLASSAMSRRCSPSPVMQSAAIALDPEWSSVAPSPAPPRPLARVVSACRLTRANGSVEGAPQCRGRAKGRGDRRCGCGVAKICIGV
mmetsp:Transcript_11219/g.34559  ORF Transcript_11219/g.34559 Transcript_11219/m.34559 type:complete len:220 (+) Transcript_11219:881-1540(+)